MGLFERDDDDVDDHAAAAPPRAPAIDRSRAPLAERMRPTTLEEFIGQPQLAGPNGLLTLVVERRVLPSIVFWGPPGCGKTTLARLLARSAGLPFAPFSAVTGGVKEVRELVAEARHRRRLDGQSTVLFVDEIHRFNKSQQDAFLPHVEDGTIVLLGATTQNPSFELTSALLSRVQVEVLEALGPEVMLEVLRRALGDRGRGLGHLELTAAPGALERIADLARGDARTALNVLETTSALVDQGGALTPEVVDQAIRGTTLRYDKTGEQHFDTVSAFIKSLRGSDPDAGLYYLARMLEGGEEPRFIARRLVVFASEDVGNADPGALAVAIDVAQAVELVGLPEARINMAQAVTYLALAPKSNASYAGLNAATDAVRKHGPLPVPLHLRNAATGLLRGLGYGRGYEYAHERAGGVGAQRHLPEKLEGARFYEPTDRGLEADLARRLERLRALRAGKRSEST
jgi:putative ATPase